MSKLIALFCVLYFLSTQITFAEKKDQSENDQVKVWFPSTLNIQPFTANFLEPKAGFAFYIGTERLRLDISTSRDIYLIKDNNSSLSFGADLFTFTRIIRGSEFHFPVETIDYLFGINAGYKVTEESCEYGIRGRLSHISAHFVDGKYDFALAGWKDGDRPRVYSREFIELFPYYQFSGLRLYAGLTYLLHVSPKGLGRDIYQLGFDYFASGLISEKVTPFAAYDFKLNKINKYSGSNIFTGGVKFGSGRGSGFSISFSYLTGKSIHGEYYDRNESYSTIGFNLDL